MGGINSKISPITAVPTGGFHVASCDIKKLLWEFLEKLFSLAEVGSEQTFCLIQMFEHLKNNV